MRPNHDRTSGLEVFAPPEALDERRHGPRGYGDDETHEVAQPLY